MFFHTDYLNNPNGKLNRHNRLIKNIFSKSWFSIELAKNMKVSSDEELSNSMLNYCKNKICSEVNYVILKLVFEWNARQRVLSSRLNRHLCEFVLFSLFSAVSCSFPGDFDIFLVFNDSSSSEVNSFFRDFLSSLSAALLPFPHVVARNNGVLMIFSKNNKKITVPPVQFILRKVSCLEELLALFDLDACRFAYDGISLFTLMEGVRALSCKINVVNREHYAKKLYFRRAIKYNNKGFETLFMNFHPFFMYFNPKFGYKSAFSYVFEENDSKPPQKKNWRARNPKYLYRNVRTDTSPSEPFDVGLYTPVLENVTYEDVEELATVGIGNYEWKCGDPEGFDYLDDGNGIPLRYRTGVKDFLEREHHIFTLGLNEFVRQDLSMLITSPYYDDHLFEKYDFLRCYICNKFRKIDLWPGQ